MYLWELGRFYLIKDIIGDGNCFFRVVFYCLICIESYYYVVWSVICNYILEYEDKF